MSETFDAYEPATKWLRRARFFWNHSWLPCAWAIAQWCSDKGDEAYTDADYW